MTWHVEPPHHLHLFTTLDWEFPVFWPTRASYELIGLGFPANKIPCIRAIRTKAVYWCVPVRRFILGIPGIEGRFVKNDLHHDCFIDR